MRHPVRIAVLLALIGIVTTGATSIAQPKGFVPPTVTDYMVGYLSDVRLQKELGLTPDQVKKLTPLFETGPFRFGGGDEKKREEPRKTQSKALTETLKPEQVKRLREITFQSLAGLNIGRLVLTADAEVVKALGLTDAQKKTIAESPSRESVLTEKQKKAWTEMVGKPYAELPVRMSGRNIISMPPELSYLAEDSVEDELKLTKKQQTQIDAVIEKWEKAYPNRFVTNADAQKKATELGKDLVKEAREALTEAQRKRLDQIALQVSLGMAGGGRGGRTQSVSTISPERIGLLKLTDEQKESIAKIRKDRQTALVDVFLDEKNAETLVEKVAEHKKETVAKVSKVLTDEQRTQMAELIGKPFTKQLQTTSFLRSFTTTPMYSEIVGVSYASSTEFQQELKLDAEQIKKLTALAEKITQENNALRRTNDEVNQKLKEQAEAVEKELGKFLKPEQRTRLKQVALQQYSSGFFGQIMGGSALIRFVEVKETLKLTEEQARRAQRGANLDKILDDTQKAKLKQMLGKAMPSTLLPPGAMGGGGMGGPGGLGGGRQSLLMELQLAQEKSVEEELKLTDAQKEAVKEQAKTYQDSYPRREGTTAQWQEKLQKYNTDAKEALAKVLDEKQSRRLKQIQFQQLSTQAFNPMPLLTNTEVAKDLKITKDQEKTLTEIRTNLQRTRSLASAELASRGLRDENSDYPRVYSAVTKKAEKQMTEVLTAAQQKALKEMLGDEFKGTLTLGQGGPGGFPGGGGLGGGGPGFTRRPDGLPF